MQNSGNRLMKFAVARFDLFEGALIHEIVEANSDIHAVIVHLNNAELLQMYTDGTLPHMSSVDEFVETYMTDEDWVSVLEL